MKLFKKFTIGLLSISFLFSLTGCRTKGGETSTETQTGATATTEKKEIVFWNLFDNSDSLKGQIQAFESSHPGVKVTYKKFVNVDEYWRTIVNELAEGEGPDIFAVNNNWIKQHSKKFQPLPMDSVEIPMNPEIFRQTFFNVAGEDLIIDNQILGIPLSIDTLALYYNKKIFGDNIIDSDEPADTWEKLKEQVITLTKANNSIERFGVSGVAMGRADNILRATDILYLLMVQQGAQFYDDTGKKAIFATKQGVAEGTGQAYYPAEEALNLYTSFGIPSYRHYAWNEFITGKAPDEKEINPFARGKTAMIFGYSFLYNQISDTIQGLTKTGGEHITLEDVGIAPVPQLYNYAETGKQDAYANYFPLVVSRNTAYPAEAWNLLLYLSTAESLQAYHEKTHKPTSRKDMGDAQSIEPLWGVFARQASYAKNLQLYDFEKFNDYFAEAIQSVVKSKKTAKEALEITQKKVNCLLDKAQPNASQDIDCDVVE